MHRIAIARRLIGRLDCWLSEAWKALRPCLGSVEPSPIGEPITLGNFRRNVIVRLDCAACPVLLTAPDRFRSLANVRTRRCSQVAKAADCKSAIVGSTPTSASRFSRFLPHGRFL